MKRLLALAALRFYLRHPWQLALALAGIALGVAVYVGVDLANDSARRAFELSAEILRGQATHRLLPVGGELDEDVYRELVLERGIAAAAPVLEADVAVAGRPDLRLRLLGVDPLEESGVRAFSGWVPGSASDIARLIAEPGTVLVPDAVAETLGLAGEASMGVRLRSGGGTLRAIGTLDAAALDPGAEPPLLADIATVQDLLGAHGTLSRIDLRLTPEQARALAEHPPRGTTLVPAGGDRAFDELARAFRTNLTALGLLALVVGMFLIYATMSFAIVQRRMTLGVLRSMGVTPRELLAGVVAEAGVLGAAATLLGLVLGHVLARSLVDLVLATIGDLSFTAAVKGAEPSRWIYAEGALLGLLATLLAGLKPALDATRVAPAAALRRADVERSARRGARRGAWLAVPAAAAGAVLLAAAPRDLTTAFAGLFCVLAAGALLTPAAALLLARLLEPAARRAVGLPGVLAVRGVGASLSRTGVATAALAVAVATVIGVGLMIASFRESLVGWLGTTLTADVYVTFGDAPGTAADDEVARGLVALPGVAGVSLTRALVLQTELGELTVRAHARGPRGWGLEIVAGGEQALDALARGDGVVVSEPLAFKRGLAPGDELSLPTPLGTERFPVVGVFRDYDTSGNSVVMALALYRERWGDHTVTGAGLHLAPDADRDALERALAELGKQRALRWRSSEAIEALSLAVFDRTFEITEVLRVLAAAVAFLGVLSSLLSIELERAREHAVLRSLGFAPRELAGLVVTQTGLLGAAAGLAAVPLGGVLAALLVHVINRRSFGWTMDFVVVPGPIVAGVALAVGAALLAGLYPAARIARGELARALREE
ncbi:MAG TPA: FtsX-like permease family protein [Natronosporangium sp.]